MIFLTEGKIKYTKYEKARIIGARALQIAMGAPVLIESDEIDPIEDNFFLEVSSPGIDRPLKTDDDFNRAIGDDVEISLYSALNGKKKLEGNLKSFDNDNVLIEVENKETIKIERSTISRINLAVKF